MPVKKRASARAKKSPKIAKKKVPRQASPASMAARDAYIERRPMRGYYLDIDQIDYIDELRRVAPGAKIPSASEVVRTILREYMEAHPIRERSTPAPKVQTSTKK